MYRNEASALRLTADSGSSATARRVEPVVGSGRACRKGDHERIVRLRGYRLVHLFPGSSFVADRREIVRHSQMRLGQVRIELQGTLRRRAHLLASDFERSRLRRDADPVHTGEPRPGRRKVRIDRDRAFV